MRTILSITAVVFAFANAARADIFQWEYINPADPSQGKQQSTTLAPDGAGVDAVPGANLSNRNLTMAYLIGADLTSANAWFAHLINADLSEANLSNASFLRARLIIADLSRSNLANAWFYGATLTDADFTSAEVKGASVALSVNFIFPVAPDYGVFYGTGITLAQLYSTASYQARDLSGIGLSYNSLAGGNFAGQNLANAAFYYATLTGADFREARLSNANFSGATLTDADFTGAEVRGANLGKDYFRGITFAGTGMTLAQLYATASYQAHDLSGVRLWGSDLTGANFAGQNLTNASFYGTTLTDADFTGAQLNGSDFGKISSRPTSGITLAQLYSTASYQAHDLSWVGLSENDLAGGNFAGQNLTNAQFRIAQLIGAVFRQANLTNADFFYATLTDADFTAADARGSLSLDVPASAITTNLIRPDGHIDGLDLGSSGPLVIRDYDGNYAGPIPITIDQHLTMGPAGTLRMVFEADAWDSTISFAPGIPVTLRGTLELTFSTDVNLATQLGRTFDLFDWTGVTPTGTFAISSPYAWDLSNLYTKGEATLLSIPEPSTLLLFGFALTAIFALGRIRYSFGANKGENQ